MRRTLVAMARPTRIARRQARGLSLIELMVALALGLLVSAGIITLFGATSRTSKIQDALARLQENGRYAATRMNDDLRMAGGQYCGNADSSGWTEPGTDGPLYPGLALMVNVNGIWGGSTAGNTTGGAFPDSGGLLGIKPTGLPANTTYSIGPADFIRGYDCDDGGSCSPAIPTGSAPDGLPDEGAADGSRVKGADVLTIRYQRGSGWPFTAFLAATPPTLSLQPSIIGGVQVDDPVNFSGVDRALMLTCGGGQVFQVSASGNTLTPVNLLDLASYKPAGTVGSFDVRIFNFTKDFLTVSYYVAYKNDPQNAGRLIPTLYRRENGQANELVQGVERLDFVYGVQYADGALHYLTADEVDANSDNTNCSPPSPALGLAAGAVEPGCLWRSVRSIEAHMLLDTVTDIPLTDADMSYRYTGRGDTAMQHPPTDANAAMDNGIRAGRMMRREFVTLVATRNGNH